LEKCIGGRSGGGRLHGKRDTGTGDNIREMEEEKEEKEEKEEWGVTGPIRGMDKEVCWWHSNAVLQFYSRKKAEKSSWMDNSIDITITTVYIFGGSERRVPDIYRNEFVRA
jgi:hypothetical protein